MKYDREKGYLKVPFSVNISITEECPLKCPACFKPFGNIKKLELEVVCSYIDELVQLGTKYVQFSGGDPLMHKDLIKMISYAKNKGMITRISTSGIGLTNEMISQFKDAGLDCCHISLNGSQEAIHNLTRSAFKGSIKALEILSNSGLQVAINWVANHMNVYDLPNVITLAKFYNVKYISILSNKRSNSETVLFPLNYDDLLFLKRNYEENKDYLIIENCFFELRNLLGESVGIEQGCRGGRFYMAINANGEFSPCPHLTPSKQKYDSIEEYWSLDSDLLKIRTFFNKSMQTKCIDCQYIQMCRPCLANLFDKSNIYQNCLLMKQLLRNENKGRED